MIKTREELFSYMVHQRKVNFTHPTTKKVVQGLIQGIEMEDGSGSSFNVTISDVTFERHTVYLRTQTPATIGPGNLPKSRNLSFCVPHGGDIT